MEEAGQIEEWLRRCRDAQLRDDPVPHQLFRRLIRHDGWLCSPDAWEVAAHGEAYVAGTKPVPDLLKGPLTGLELAHALPAGMAKLQIHFGDAPPLELDAEAITELRSFLQVEVVEELLRRLYEGAALEVSEPFARLRDFEGFYILCAGARGQLDSELATSSLRIAYAPDPENARALAAIFTAQDALQLFVVATPHSRESDGLVSVRLSGRELFEMVRQQRELDGIVFNPAGPGQAFALSCAFADQVLQGE